MVQKHSKKTAVASMAVGASALLLGLSAVAGPNDPTADPNNWPEYHRTGHAWRYSPLSDINKSNVAKLEVAWIHQPGNITHGLQATPIVIDGMLYYVGAYNNVYAVNAATGKTVWHYQPKLDPVSNDVFYIAASRGVTVGRGKVFLGTLDGRFIALDQKSGKPVWETQLTNLKKEYGALFSSPPQLAGNVLYGGTTGGDQPIQGKIYAVDADTGQRLWTFNTIKDDPASWPGDTGKVGGGGAWLPGTYDAETDSIFIGTSNAAPDYFPAERKGDNLYTATLLALDPKTGNVKWHRQEVPNDAWDYDAPYEAVQIKHKDKDVLVHLNKGGFVFVMDKRNGDLVNTWPLNDNINWVKNIDPKTGELIGRVDPKMGERITFCPWLLGGRSWNHGAYSPKTNLWYTNTMEACNEIVSGKEDPSKIGISGLYLGIADLKTVPPPSGKGHGKLVAVDPISGKKKWAVEYPVPALSSVLATGGGLIFNGDIEGNIYAYDADSGKTLWNFPSGSGLRGGPVTYKANGEQFIVVPTGLGSHAPGFMASAFPEIKNFPGGAALIAFKVKR
ncbi:MAG: pyrroloquinoline quinone-dependent dehydrogenase [Burkholderiaceae bacterium]